MEVGGAEKNEHVATAIAIAGRSCRPCDVCGRDQARWFCASDEAYLCGKCDGSVHGANAVASRHERSPLGPTGLPMKSSSMSSYSTYLKSHGSKGHSASGFSVSTLGLSRKKPRSIRPHPHIAIATAAASADCLAKDQPKATRNVKNEPASHLIMHQPSEEIAATIKSFQNEGAHEVPIFVPSLQDLFPPSFYNCSLIVDASSGDGFATEEAETFQECDSKCDFNGFLDSRMELRLMKEDMDTFMGEENRAMDELTVVDELGLFSLCGEHLTNEEYGLEFSRMGSFIESTEASEGEVGDASKAVDGSFSDLCWRVKMEKDDSDETEKLKLEVDELLACALVTGIKEEEEEAAGSKVSLKLNYEDVLSAWSDRGSLWTDGRRPQIVPELDDSVRSLDIGLVPDLCFCSSPPVEQVGLVPVASMGEDSSTVGGREARVMRYRAKRRTRLFSKRIRYEVRKLNAEMRPRWKGRFVKRSTGIS
ncbi:hypothetical protein O6H91_06G005000 [Diphasiastrum complanatum]|uniref:Uncharacterized protein n=1 Tax=Diphasiastrum complanatum TaxID=34168 RepID=A0ACC2DA98_DIPCM|nr:hypothetical protein O6H91_06G005000 [Diphasiastrum complanatum]